MIKTAIRLRSGSVFVFDEDGEQLPRYQGRYDTVKEAILRDAAPGALFYCLVPGGRMLEVRRNEW